MPTALAERVPDAFAYDFLRACAAAELCFRPDEVQFGYWACDKLNSYLRNGDEPHRGGPSVLAPLHIFDVMDVAYTHPEGGFLSKHVQESLLCQPYRDDHTLFILDFLVVHRLYPRWRLIGAYRVLVATHCA